MSTPELHTQTITRCAAGRGWLWWAEAFRMVKEAPGPWFIIGLGYIGIFIFPSLLLSMVAATSKWTGFIGYLPAIIAPCFIVGFVAAGWTQVRGGTPQLSHLFNGFKADVKTLMGIGAVTVVLILLSGLAFETALGSSLIAEFANLGKKDPMAMLAFFTSSRLWLAVLVFVVLLTLIWLATWLAPMVVVFQRTGVANAMQSSLKALLVNWRALSVYALVPIVASFIVSIVMAVLGVVAAIAGKGGEVVILILFLGLLPLLISLGTLTAFVAYCDIFHAKDAVFPRPPKEPAL